MRGKIVRIAGWTASLLLVAVGVVFGSAWLLLDRAGWARAVIWMDADVDDHQRFPSRAVPKGASPYIYAEGAGYPDGLPRNVELPAGYQRLDDLLAQNDTTAFIVVKEDQLIYEHYFNGSSHEAVQTSFSMAKSFNSAMLGAALADGSIASADDPITKYIPELLDRDRRYGEITIRHLVTMSSGLHYEEYGLPWSDDAQTYYNPDLRQLALTGTSIEGAPGQHFHYNNFNPLLFGMIIERATGKHVAEYLSEKIWQPMGAEAGATWSLDSEASGFEKMESGINARAIDFAKLGSLYLYGGTFNGQTILPRAWVEESTLGLRPTGIGSSRYGHGWWTNEDESAGKYFVARGNHGQLVFVFPEKRLIVSRNGKSYGAVDWSVVAVAIARAF